MSKTGVVSGTETDSVLIHAAVFFSGLKTLYFADVISTQSGKQGIIIVDSRIL